MVTNVATSPPSPSTTMTMMILSNTSGMSRDPILVCSFSFSFLLSFFPVRHMYNNEAAITITTMTATSCPTTTKAAAAVTRLETSYVQTIYIYCTNVYCRLHVWPCDNSKHHPGVNCGRTKYIQLRLYHFGYPVHWMENPYHSVLLPISIHHLIFFQLVLTNVDSCMPHRAMALTHKLLLPK
jgi:hypothetical protein